jgi:hypothetical protein
MAVLVLVTIGCAPDPPAATVAVGGEHEVEARFTDGTVARGWDEYETAITARIPAVEQLSGYAMRVEDDPQPAAGPPGTELITWQIGKFAVSIDPDFSYIGGCVRQHFLHLRVRLENQHIPAPLIELHVTVWLEKNRPCIGVMNKSPIGYGWCQKLCWTATKQDITRAITGGLVSAGVAGTAAAIIGRVITPVAIAALAL